MHGLPGATGTAASHFIDPGDGLPAPSSKPREVDVNNLEERTDTAVVELPENRNVPATPETIEALMRDAGDPDPQ